MSPGVPSRERAASSYNRRRAGNACLICRSRKTKCDNQRPVCGFCAATGGECRYNDSDPSQFDRASLAILQRLSELESTLVSHIDQSLRQHELYAGDGTRIRQGVELEAPAESQSGSYGGDSTVPWAAGTFHSLPEDMDSTMTQDGPEKHGKSDVSEDRPPSSNALRHVSEMFADSILKWPIFSQAVPHLSEELHIPILQVWAQAGVSSTMKQNQMDKQGPTNLNLNSEVINDLVENFLANNHVKNPILNVMSLRADVREFEETGAQWDERSCLVLLVCAVSSLSAPLDQETTRGTAKNPIKLAMAHAYFQASQRRLGILYHENSLVVAQCSFLTGVYLMSTMRILAAWKCFVQAGTQCLAWLTSQGRMKSTITTWPETYRDRYQEEKDLANSQAEESLYWSCLKSEIELRLELGLPGSGINEVEYPYLFPSPPEAVRKDGLQPAYDTPDGAWSSPSSLIRGNDRQNLELGWFFYLAEIALKRIVHNVTTWLYSMKTADQDGRSTQYSEKYLQAGAAEFETQIQDWYNTLPPPMQFPKSCEEVTGDILRFILRGHMIDIREVVRFPAIHTVLSSPTPFSHESTSATCIRLAQELLENAVERIKINREGWYHRHQGTWLMMRSCTRSALHLIGMALKCQEATVQSESYESELEHEMLPSDWKEAVEQVIDLLDYWADESSDMKRLGDILKEFMLCYEKSRR